MRALLLAAFLLPFLATPVRAECHPIPITSYSPTGVAGCSTYGSGWASWWSGPGVARNDCVWPWTDCQPIRITSLDTGRSVTVTPTMYCDCFAETPNQRLVDLDPASLSVLGLVPSRGLFRVEVSPATSSPRMGSTTPMLPDTALR